MAVHYTRLTPLLNFLLTHCSVQLKLCSLFNNTSLIIIAMKEVFSGNIRECCLFADSQMAVHYTRLTPLLNFLLAHTAVCTAELEIVLLMR